MNKLLSRFWVQIWSQTCAEHVNSRKNEAEFRRKTDYFITKWKMQGFGFMTFTINLHDTLTANTWRFTPRHQPYELCNPSTCYLITLEISTASDELKERCFISSFHYPSPIISTAFLTAPVSQSFQRNMTSIFHLLGRKKNPQHILKLLEVGQILWNFP